MVIAFLRTDLNPNELLQLVICHQISGSANVRALNSKYALQCSGYLWDNLIQCHIRLSQQLKHSILLEGSTLNERKMQNSQHYGDYNYGDDDDDDDDNGDDDDNDETIFPQDYLT